MSIGRSWDRFGWRRHLLVALLLLVQENFRQVVVTGLAAGNLFVFQQSPRRSLQIHQRQIVGHLRIQEAEFCFCQSFLGCQQILQDQAACTIVSCQLLPPFLQIHQFLIGGLHGLVGRLHFAEGCLNFANGDFHFQHQVFCGGIELVGDLPHFQAAALAPRLGGSVMQWHLELQPHRIAGRSGQELVREGLSHVGIALQAAGIGVHDQVQHRQQFFIGHIHPHRRGLHLLQCLSNLRSLLQRRDQRLAHTDGYELANRLVLRNEFGVLDVGQLGIVDQCSNAGFRVAHRHFRAEEVGLPSRDCRAGTRNLVTGGVQFHTRLQLVENATSSLVQFLFLQQGSSCQVQTPIGPRDLQQVGL